MKNYADFPELLETFFTDRLMQQRQASSHTIESYRDTFHLLLEFAQQRLKKAPSTLELKDIDATFIGTFLNHLEKERGISARSRNIRLSAIHSFFKYAALQKPEYSALIQRVLSIPTKRYNRVPVNFLTRLEIDALLVAPDRNTWLGRRDYTLLLVAAQTGLRVSELIGLKCQDIVLGNGAHVHCLGKGRKERCTPLRKEAIAALRTWLHERNGQPSDILFPNVRGSSFSRDGVEYLLTKHVSIAQKQCPSLKNKRVSPHILRHSAAMDLLQHGVDHAVIALWLGHESSETTKIYLHANPELKEKALARTTPFNTHIKRYKPDDKLLAFLKGL